MYNRSISLKYFWKDTSYINEAIIDKQSSINLYYVTLRRYNWSMPQCGKFIINLYDAE